MAQAAVVKITWEQVQQRVDAIVSVRHLWCGDVQTVHGVPRGGLVPAALVAGAANLPLVEEPDAGTLVIDDLVESGRTARRYLPLDRCATFIALYHKPGAPSGFTLHSQLVEGWLEFPWERAAAELPARDAIVRLEQAADTARDPRKLHQALDLLREAL